MATMHCPYCHVHTSIALKYTKYRHSDSYGNQASTAAIWHADDHTRWWIGTCNHCGEPVLVLNNGEKVFPNPKPSPTPGEIPQEIRSNLVEAKECATVNAWRATVTMCRRSIQMACLDKGAPQSSNLVAQINYLRDNHIITNDVHEWATLVRWVGNDGAHPGGNEPDQEDAMAMIDLASQFLHVLYVAPAKAAAHRAKLGK